MANTDRQDGNEGDRVADNLVSGWMGPIQGATTDKEPVQVSELDVRNVEPTIGSIL